MSAPGVGWNHLAGGVAAAAAVPAAVFGLHLPFLVGLLAGAGVYGGLALALTPRRASDRVDPARVGKAQAELVGRLIEEAEPEVVRLDAAGRRLADPGSKRLAADMATTARTILARLAAEPGSLPAVRRVLTYYLPASADLVEGLGTLEGSGADPARLAEARATLARLDRAFTHYAGSLAGAELDALDVEIKLLGQSLADDLGPAFRAPDGAARPRDPAGASAGQGEGTPWR